MVCRTFKLTLFEIVESPLGFNGVAQNLSLKLCGFLGNSKLERHWVPCRYIAQISDRALNQFLKRGILSFTVRY